VGLGESKNFYNIRPIIVMHYIQTMTLRRFFMFRHGIWWRLLLVLVLAALLIGGGTALYRLAWTQGYQTGILAAGAAGKAVTPPIPYYGFYPYAPYGPGFGFPFFFNPFGLLLGIVFFFLIFSLIRGLFFRPWGWRHGAGPYEHGYGPYGHRGPWGANQTDENQYKGPHGTGGFSA
jgi:hypothetical protein